MKLKKKFRIVRNTVTKYYVIQYSYLGLIWTNWNGWKFTAQTDAEDSVGVISSKDSLKEKWEVVRTYNG